MFPNSGGWIALSRETDCAFGGWHEVVFEFIFSIWARVASDKYTYNSDAPQRKANVCRGLRVATILSGGGLTYPMTRRLHRTRLSKQAIQTYGPLAASVAAIPAGGILTRSQPGNWNKDYPNAVFGGTLRAKKPAAFRASTTRS